MAATLNPNSAFGFASNVSVVDGAGITQIASISIPVIAGQRVNVVATFQGSFGGSSADFVTVGIGFANTSFDSSVVMPVVLAGGNCHGTATLTFRSAKQTSAWTFTMYLLASANATTTSVSAQAIFTGTAEASD